MFRLWFLLLAALLLNAGCQTSTVSEAGTASPYVSDLRGAVFDPPRPLADFTIESTTGEDFTLSEHQSQVILLYFGYRSCPDFCPTTFSELQRVYKELDEPEDKLKIVFVTIDPERDTLDYLGLYVRAFHEDFIGLRTEGEALQQIEREFGVVAERRVVGESALSYLFDHTASIFLIGADGRLEAQYLYGTNYRDIVHDLQLILETI